MNLDIKDNYNIFFNNSFLGISIYKFNVFYLICSIWLYNKKKPISISSGNHFNWYKINYI